MHMISLKKLLFYVINTMISIMVYPLQANLVFSQGSYDQRTDHPRQGSNPVGDAHEDAGVARGDVQMVYVEA